MPPRSWRPMDVVSYSRLMSVDARATVAALDDAHNLFRSHMEGQGGPVIDMSGDLVMSKFDTGAAVSCSVEPIRGDPAADPTGTFP